MVRLTTIIICLVISSITACTVDKGVAGDYTSKAKDYKMYVTLRKDSSFSIYNSGFEYQKNGKGSWKMQAEDTVLLVFDNFDPKNSFILTHDYIKGDTLTLRVVNSGRLKYYKARLTKVKSNLFE